MWRYHSEDWRSRVCSFDSHEFADLVVFQMGPYTSSDVVFWAFQVLSTFVYWKRLVNMKGMLVVSKRRCLGRRGTLGPHPQQCALGRRWRSAYPGLWQSWCCSVLLDALAHKHGTTRFAIEGGFCTYDPFNIIFYYLRSYSPILL